MMLIGFVFVPFSSGSPLAEYIFLLATFLPIFFAILLIYKILLYFEGGIESAIGAHIANNIFVFALLGYEDPVLPNTAFFTLGEPVISWSDFWLVRFCG